MCSKSTAAVLLLALLAIETQAGVLRTDDGTERLATTTARANEGTLLKDATNGTEASVKSGDTDDAERRAAPALSKDEDASIKIFEVTVDSNGEEHAEVFPSVAKVPQVAQSRDKPATVQILEISVDSEADGNADVLLVSNAAAANEQMEAAEEEELEKAVALAEAEAIHGQSSFENLPKLERTAKLLLESAPKHERTKPLEAGEEEEEENFTASSTETNLKATETPNLSTTDEKNTNKNKTSPAEESPNVNVTQLFPINTNLTHVEQSKSTAAIAKDDKRSTKDNGSAHNEEEMEATEALELEKKTAEAAAEAVVVTSAVDSPEPQNMATTVLLETEAGYVLVDGDVEEQGTFTHVDSEEYLQPIVESVEIVPTSFDDPLIVNYVHHW